MLPLQKSGTKTKLYIKSFCASCPQNIIFKYKTRDTVARKAATTTPRLKEARNNKTST